jgi:hypothetical protein
MDAHMESAGIANRGVWIEHESNAMSRNKRMGNVRSINIM